jgi:hypothetical protein
VKIAILGSGKVALEAIGSLDATPLRGKTLLDATNAVTANADGRRSRWR